MMKYRKLGQSDIQATAISMGAWAIGGDSNWGANDDSVSIRTIEAARENGVVYIDTAPAYGLGHSEEVVGQAIKAHRSDYILQTKCGLCWDVDPATHYLNQHRDGKDICRDLSAEGIARQVDQSLARLQTDYIDIFVTHWQSMPPNQTPIEETMDALMGLVKAGKIRAIGISNVTPEQIRKYSACGPIALVQQRFSMLTRDCEQNGVIDTCKELGITFQAYSPLERGLLTGKVKMDTELRGNAKIGNPMFELENRAKILKMLDTFVPLTEKYNCSMSSLVIAWTVAQGEWMNVLCGARKPEQIIDNAQGGVVTLDPADVAFMDAAARAIL